MKFVLACGGTGGHIFPAFSVAEELRRRDPACGILYVCGKKDIENEIFKIVSAENVVSIESAPFRGALSLCNPLFLLKLGQGFTRARRLLKDQRPDLVIGFGGHYSFPVVLTARWMGIPALIHEQNVVPGLANKALARFVDGVALSFAETREFLPRGVKARVTGNPIRSSIERDRRSEALKYFGFSADRATALVLGGSQGSESINTVFLESLRGLPPEVKSKIQVLHLCGRSSPARAEQILESLGIPGRAYSFFERMDLAYSAADFALGRAGATFLAEIAAKRIPAILVPYPFGDGHQRANAKAYAALRPAVIVEQSRLRPERLTELLIAAISRSAEFSEADFGAAAPVRRSADAFPPEDGSASAEMAGPASENSRTRLADYILETARKS